MATKRRRATRKRKTNGKVQQLSPVELNALLELAKNVEKYAPIIRKKLRAAGVEPNEAFVIPAAMYYEALDRLAKE